MKKELKFQLSQMKKLKQNFIPFKGTLLHIIKSLAQNNMSTKTGHFLRRLPIVKLKGLANFLTKLQQYGVTLVAEFGYYYL